MVYTASHQFDFEEFANKPHFAPSHVEGILDLPPIGNDIAIDLEGDSFSTCSTMLQVVSKATAFAHSFSICWHSVVLFCIGCQLLIAVIG